MRKWLCTICGLVYDEAKGWPDDGIAPGTRWEDVPDTWTCPDCGVGKTDFEMIEVTGTAEAVAPVLSQTQIQTQVKPQPLPQSQSQQESPIVIVGSGHAGYSLAKALRERNATKEIILFTQDDGANYSKPQLSNALANGKTADDLVAESLLDVAQRLKLAIHARCTVSSIDPTAHEINTDYGKQPYSKLVLAQGADTIKLSFEGNAAHEVISVNDLRDYRNFRKKLENVRRIALIGNGLIGCEFANDLAASGYEVSVIGLTSWPMDSLIPQIIGQRLQEKLSEYGVQWYLNNTVKKILHAGGSYQLALKNGEAIEADLVLSAVGLSPRTQLAQAAGIECNKGIVVNGGLRTSVADVYALGDCAEIQGRLMPYIAPINFAVPALADCILGRPTMANFPLMPVLVKTPVLPLTVLPPPTDLAGDWQIKEDDAGIRALFLDTEGALKGFVLAGKQTQERQQWLNAFGEIL